MNLNPSMAISPELRRRNLVLGGLLGALAILLTALFVVIFIKNGLPKDPGEWRRLEAHQQAESAVTHAESTSK